MSSKYETAENEATKKEFIEKSQRLVASASSFLNSSVVAFIESVPQLHENNTLPSKQGFASIIEEESNKQAFAKVLGDFDENICKFVCDENGAKALQFAAMLLEWRRSVPCTETDSSTRMVDTVMTLVLDFYVFYSDKYVDNK